MHPSAPAHARWRTFGLLALVAVLAFAIGSAPSVLAAKPSDVSSELATIASDQPATVAAAPRSPSGAIFLKIHGTKQGTFTGDGLSKLHEGMIETLAVRQEVESPRDAASGLPTGRRMYKPIVLLTNLGAHSVQEAQALAENEILDKVTIEFWKASATGKEELFFTIKLENAAIASHIIRAGATGDVAPSGSPDFLDEISLTFQTIEWTYKSGKPTFSDSWSLAR